MGDSEIRFATTMREADRDEPGLVLESDGTISVVKPGGARTELGAGGGSQTYQSRSSYSGDSVTVTTGVGSPTNLTWDSLGSGAALLDLTDPAIPVVVAGGIYSVTAIVICDEFLTAGGAFLVGLHLDGGGDDAVSEMSGGSGTQKPATDIQAVVSVNNTYYIPPGGDIRVTVVLADGASNRAFRLREAIIQQLPGGP